VDLETKILGKILGEQKLKVIRYVAANADAEGFLLKTVAQICEDCGATKPTVIAALKTLEEKKALKPLKRGLYKIFL
jgi:DNA-binding IclR family transcriptional regulator